MRKRVSHTVTELGDSNWAEKTEKLTKSQKNGKIRQQEGLFPTSKNYLIYPKAQKILVKIWWKSPLQDNRFLTNSVFIQADHCSTDINQTLHYLLKLGLCSLQIEKLVGEEGIHLAVCLWFSCQNAISHKRDLWLGPTKNISSVALVFENMAHHQLDGSPIGQESTFMASFLV